MKKLFFSKIFRDFRLILTPKRGILHSKFKAFTVDGDGQEKPVFVGKFNLVMRCGFQSSDTAYRFPAILGLILPLLTEFFSLSRSLKEM